MPNELILRVMRAMDGETFFAFRNASKHINNLFLREDGSGQDNMNLVTRTLNAWLETFLTEEEIARGFVGRDVLRVGVNSIYNLPHIHAGRGIVWSMDVETDVDIVGAWGGGDDSDKLCREIMEEVKKRIPIQGDDDAAADEWLEYREPTKTILGTKCQKEILNVHVRDLVQKTQHTALNLDTASTLDDIIRRGVRDGFGVSVDREFYRLFKEMRRLYRLSLIRTNGLYSTESWALELDALYVQNIAILLRETQNVPLLAVSLLVPYHNMREMRNEKERLLFLVSQPQFYGGVEQIENPELLDRYFSSTDTEYYWMTSRISPWFRRTENDVNRALQELNAMKIAFEMYPEPVDDPLNEDFWDQFPEILMRLMALESLYFTTRREMAHKALALFKEIVMAALAKKDLSSFRSWRSTERSSGGGIISYIAKFYLVVMSKMRFLSRGDGDGDDDDEFLEFTKALERFALASATYLDNRFYQPMLGQLAPSARPPKPPIPETRKLIQYARKAYGLPPPPPSS